MEFNLSSLSVEALTELRASFAAAEARGRDGLSLDEWMRLPDEQLGELRGNDRRVLFRRMDANDDGTLRCVPSSHHLLLLLLLRLPSFSSPSLLLPSPSLCSWDEAVSFMMADADRARAARAHEEDEYGASCFRLACLSC